ncbi:MAG: beta-ketoacyl-[acyl-carrier-protein] synthase family protein, partial [Planctomycetota bacterium]|nr:beta-ketoacyl-[acyl-carrier-protein] synthase family protein [Planctomycetota bacterium]
MTRRVAITGIGLITPIGTGLEKFWEAARKGLSGVRRIEAYDPSPYPAQIAGEIRDFDITDYPQFDKPKRLSRAAQFTLACTVMAFADAGLSAKSPEVREAGTFIGTGQGGAPQAEGAYGAFFTKGWRKIPALTITRAMPNQIANHVAIEFGLGGPNVTITNACSSSAEATGRAFEQIRAGKMPLAITGGTEAMIFEAIMSAWCKLRVLSARNAEPEAACRPFDADRDGMVMSEGAGIFVLEDLERAKARGAKIHAEIIGFGSSCDAYHITAPSVEGQARAIRLALDDAGVKPDAVGYVNAHGTSTPLNDLAETKSIKEVYGKRAYQIPISALKSMTGHSLGAAGVMELASTALPIRASVIPPTINLTNPDPGCDLDYVPGESR